MTFEVLSTVNRAAQVNVGTCVVTETLKPVRQDVRMHGAIMSRSKRRILNSRTSQLRHRATVV